MKFRSNRFAKFVGAVSLGIGLVYSYNYFVNTRQEKEEAFSLISEATFPMGYREYTRFRDGTETLLTAPRIGFITPTRISRNTDGDDKINIIRENSSNFLIPNNIFVRGSNYQEYKIYFDEEDRKLEYFRRKLFE